MFDALREKMRKKREKKQRMQAVYSAIPTDNPDRVKQALDALRQVELTTEDKGALVKAAIDNQTVAVFKEVLAFADDPNIDVKNTVRRGDNYVTSTYTPISYAIQVARTHDISLLLANNPRTNISGELMDYARNHGMQDVAIVLTKRIAELRRQEAALLDREAGEAAATESAGPAAVTAPAAAVAAEGNETWTLVAKQSVAHVTHMEALNRKITEIFNFESRERALITENLKTGAETVGTPESFDAIAPANVQRAADMLKSLTTDGGAKRTFSL